MVIGAAAATMLAGNAHAFVIVPTFDNSLASNANAAALEAAINTAVGTIDGLYSNPGTIKVLFEFNSAVLGQTQNGESFVTYSQYTARLAADSAAHPNNTVLATAVANLSHGNTGDWVLGTTAYLRVGLGFSGAGTTPCFNSSGGFVAACNAVFDAIVTIGNVSTASGGAGKNSQAVSVVEHELNEVLGGGGGGTTIGLNYSAFVTGVAIGPIDPYRYQSTKPDCSGVDSTPSYTTNANAVACYSIDGGVTSLVQMNQAGGGSDYGDFATTSPNIPYIQDAFYPGTTDIYSTSSPEYVMQESIGYNGLPEPSTIALLLGAVGGLGWTRRRRLATVA